MEAWYAYLHSAPFAFWSALVLAFLIFFMIPFLRAQCTGIALYTGSGRTVRNGLGKREKRAAPLRLHPKAISRGILEDHFIEQLWVRKKATKKIETMMTQVDLKVVGCLS